VARRAAGVGVSQDTYWARSMRPLHILVFLLPLLIAYEVGSIVFLSDRATGSQTSVAAFKLFNDFFRVFGIAGAFLPGVALVVVLLLWHVMIKDRWKIEGRTLAGMVAESLAWTMPLLVMAAATNHARASLGTLALSAGDNAFMALPTLAAAAPSMGSDLLSLPLGARVTISVGAGLYEEMLFRLVGLALLHFVLVDLIGLTQRWGSAVAIVLCAMAFAVYHGPQLPAQWAEFVFMMLAGIYFGTIYVMRGFGIVVATHAIYDVLVLVVLQGSVRS
jgi:membrane protease YdiL (CAAX protease family)